MSAFKLAVFNCNGVLVGSERIACEVLKQCLAGQGLVMDSQEVCIYPSANPLPNAWK
ncbi:hypothetical protein [Neisseria yangbaofengii]|uniref:hypothetical protein n=1 Tax=Neisseria yangbaofengii TaxID=2709396 RepID=UPI0013EC1803|nr:hypothetical protein [Neisseria yangbaofengii]